MKPSSDISIVSASRTTEQTEGSCVPVIEIQQSTPMTEQFTPWDSAEYLRTDEEIAAYLDACFEEAGADAGFIIRALETVARAKGLDAAAERAGPAPAQLRDLFAANSSTPFGDVSRIFAVLGIGLHADKAV